MEAQSYFDRANELAIEQSDRFAVSNKTEEEFLKEPFEAGILRQIQALRKRGDELLNNQTNQ